MKQKLSKDQYKVKQPHWYKIYIEECVLCGGYEEFRERHYGKKPDDPKEWYEFSQSACEEHFM